MWTLARKSDTHFTTVMGVLRLFPFSGGLVPWRNHAEMFGPRVPVRWKRPGGSFKVARPGICALLGEMTPHTAWRDNTKSWR